MAKREKVERVSIDKFLTMSEAEQRFEIYDAICDVADQVADIENQADEMMSGDMMSGMMEKMVGGMM